MKPPGRREYVALRMRLGRVIHPGGGRGCWYPGEGESGIAGIDATLANGLLGILALAEDFLTRSKTENDPEPLQTFGNALEVDTRTCVAHDFPQVGFQHPLVEIARDKGCNTLPIRTGRSGGSRSIGYAYETKKPHESVRDRAGRPIPDPSAGGQSRSRSVRTQPGSVRTKSAPKAVAGVWNPIGASPAATRRAHSTAARGVRAYPLGVSSRVRAS